MTHEDKGSYGKKRPPDLKLNPAIAERVKQGSAEGKISCAAAFKVASELKVAPEEVSATIDLLEIPIIKCQLGLFGYAPVKRAVKAAETVSPALEAAIRESLVKGKFPCASAWEIAQKFKIAKMEVSSASEALKIKISTCQLETF
ncbi:MAG: hypothetical protein HY892_16615 [Deltaproteobacteria bacterium]|nr:hypothetical protein [Deltaproteobacteria bacterium]